MYLRYSYVEDSRALARTTPRDRERYLKHSVLKVKLVRAYKLGDCYYKLGENLVCGSFYLYL